MTILGDVAPWIWNLAAEHLSTRIEIADIYHASEHLWSVARAVLAAETAASAWAHIQMHALAHVATAPVLDALARLGSTDPIATEVLRQERAYFRKNASRMDYPTYRAHGLPLGSGAVESAGKHVVQQGLKRAGSRW